MIRERKSRGLGFEQRETKKRFRTDRESEEGYIVNRERKRRGLRYEQLEKATMLAF